MIIELDGLSISSEQDFHKRIASAFSWAQYYGNNLNSLWICSVRTWSVRLK
ncbi:barstar family protein [Pseudomonas sp. Irchel 3F6]|uniref:barstar family protein n=1 Tax=Pseudomonas sp. Irchel 3F6 TaxID=2009003 RepID=UPI0035313CC0